jgi:hypothetical protein
MEAVDTLGSVAYLDLHDKSLDERDQKILDKIMVLRNNIQRPRIGDFLRFQTGELERLSHDWGDGFQTSPGGSFFLSACGNGSFSGGLNPITPLGRIELTSETLPGRFWFFHHGFPGAGRGVDFFIPCRVYRTTATYEGFLS